MSHTLISTHLQTQPLDKYTRKKDTNNVLHCVKQKLFPAHSDEVFDHKICGFIPDPHPWGPKVATKTMVILVLSIVYEQRERPAA